MRLLALALLLTTASARAFSHDDLVHGLAHAEAGVLVAESIHVFDKGLPSWEQATLEIGGSVMANAFYELATSKPTNTALINTGSAALSAVAYRVSLSWEW